MDAADPRRREDNETGASSVEYGLLAAGVAGVVVAIIFATGGVTEEMYGDTCAAMAAQSAISAACS